MAKLSTRLQFFLENLLPGADVWDICCDHGLLGEAALRSGQFGHVYFVDQVPHITRALEEKLDGVESATVLCQDGSTLVQEVTGSVVIAGVGPDTVLDILRGLLEQNRLKASRLILSPHRSEQYFVAELKKLMPSKWIIRDGIHVTEGPRQRLIVLVDNNSVHR